MDRKRVFVNILAPIFGCLLFIAIWYALAAIVDMSLILPSPTDTVREFVLLLGDSTFYSAVGRTLLRSLLAFLIGFALATVFAVLSACFPIFKKVFAPFSVILRVLPTISVILLVLVWFRSRVAPFVVTFLVIFPMLYTTVLNAIEGVDPRLKEMTDAYRFSMGKKILHLYIPQMTPAILTGVSITLSFTVKLTIAAEVLSYGNNSIGFFMQRASVYLETATLLAWTLAAILLGFLLEGVVLLIKKLLVRHYYGK